MPETELDRSHTEEVQYHYHKGGLLRQGTTEEHVEENNGEGAGKAEDDLDRHGEEGSRSRGVADLYNII